MKYLRVAWDYMLTPYRDVLAGMDASQMDESLYEAQWAGEEEYRPFAGGRIGLE